MRSLQAQRVDPKNESNYSDLKVMRSAAGYYVGTSYRDPTFGFEEPGTRDSFEYFSSAAEAQICLEKIIAGTYTLRMNP